MPAYQAGTTLPLLLQDLTLRIPPERIAVIDDGSTDDTAAAARRAGAHLLRLPFNMGYGAALQTGYKFALRDGYDCVVQLDGDGQHEPADIPALLGVIERGEADLALGSRFLAGTGYRPPLLRRLGMGLFRFLASDLTGVKLSDVTSGFQALNRDLLTFFAGDRYPVDYPDADVLVMLQRAGFRIKEVPVTMYENPRMSSMHSGLRPIYYVFKMLLSIALTPLRRETVERKDR